LYELDPLTDSRWDAFVRDHPQSSLFHSTKWLAALKKAYGYGPVVVTTCPADAPLTNGLVFCLVESLLTGRRLVSLPFSDHCELLADDEDELDDLLSLMQPYIESGGWRYLEVRPVASRPGGLKRFTSSAPYLLHRLSLAGSTREIFQRFHKSCVQRKIRRAERERLRYEEGRTEVLFRHFYRLLVMTRRRLFLPPQPQFWFRALIEAFGEDLKIRVAFKDDLPVASIMTIAHKDVMVYKYGCSDAQFNRFGGMALLFWNTIQEAKERGCRELDMGRSDCSDQGLIAFKERWGASSTLLRYFRYPAEPVVSTPVWHESLRRRLVPAIPSAALKMVGNLLYGHMG